jgi:hypothetical protein
MGLPEINTDLIVTVSGLFICAIVAVISYRLHTRENNTVKPRMIPWIIIAIGCVATGFMLLVHLVNLFGFETGGRR